MTRSTICTSSSTSRWRASSWRKVRTQPASELLERLRQAAEAQDRLGSVIEISIVQALAYQAQGNTSAALAALERALTLAEPEGYVRIFVDEGEADAIVDC